MVDERGSQSFELDLGVLRLDHVIFFSWAPLFQDIPD